MGDITRPDPISEAERIRDMLLEEGYSRQEVNKIVFGGSGFATSGQAPEVVGYPDNETAGALQLAQQVQDHQMEAEIPDVQDDNWFAKVFKSAGAVVPFTSEALSLLRKAKQQTREEQADNYTRLLQKGKDKAGDVVAIGLGLADPFIRGQQALFDWLAGEGGMDVIIDDLFNPFLMDEETGEYYITTPLLETTQYLWGKVAGVEDMPDMEQVKRVNEMYAQSNIREFSEVVDAWAGGATPLSQDPTGTKEAVGALRMDEMYRQMSDAGVPGKIAMGALATLYAGGEIFVDPLFMAADAPVMAVNVGRKLLPTSVKAAKTARVAQRIQTLDKAQEAVRASKEHLEAMLRAQRQNPSTVTNERLKQAAYNHAKNVKRLDDMKDPGAFETITYGHAIRRKPEAVRMTERTPITEEIVPLSPTRGVSRERALKELQDRVDDLVDAEGLPSKMAPDAKIRYKELDKLRKKIRKMDEDEIPDVLTVRGEQIRTRTAEEIGAELRAQRMRALEEEYPPIMDYGDPELPLGEAAKRIVGADAGEDAGDAMRILLNGGTVDDATMSSLSFPTAMNASSSMAPGVTKAGLIDMHRVNRTLKQWRTKLKKLDTQQEIKFDWDALPKISSNLDGFKAAFADMMGRALYPNSTRMRMPGAIKAFLFNLRDPQRVIEGMDPGAWGIWRNATRGMEGEIGRFNNLFHRELERFGALASSKTPKIRSLVVESEPVSYKVNEDLSERLFLILNTTADDPEHVRLMDELTDTQKEAVQNIRTVLDRAAEKQGLTGTDKYLEGYIHHMFDKKNFAKGAVPPEMRGMSPQASVFVAHLLDRTGKAGFRPDAVAALDVYTRSMGRKLWLEPALKQMQAGAEAVSLHRSNRWYKHYMDNFVANAKGQRSFVGSLVDRFLGDIAASSGPVKAFGKELVQPSYSPGGLSRKLGALGSLLYTALLSGNLRYPIMSIATALNTTGSKYGTLRTLRGLFSSATAEGQALINATGVRKHWAQILEIDGTVQRLTEKITKLRFPGRPSVQDTEALIRGMTMHAALDDIATKFGYSSLDDLYNSPYKNRAIMDAIRTTEEVNHYFGAGSRPPIFDRLSASAGRLGTQFLSFTPKQTEQVWALYKENPGYILRYLMLAGWLQRTSAEDLGVDLSEYLGFGYMPRGVEDVTAPGVELMWDLTRWMTATNDLMFGEGDLKTVDDRTERLMTSAENLVPLRIGVEQLAKQAEAVEFGTQTTARGELTRRLELDMGRKGQRGDLMSVIMQVKSMKGRATERARKRISKLQRDYMYETESLMRTFIEAVHEGKPEIFERAAQDLNDRGFPINVSTNEFVRRIEAENLEWWLRELDDNKKLLPQVIEIMTEEGLLPAGKLPEEE